MDYINSSLTHKLQWFYLSAIVLLLFSGCNISQEISDKTKGSQGDVLLADECGFDGLKCCDNPDQQCKYGQMCCVATENNQENYCAEDCELGKEKAFCRQSEPSCDPGLSCRDKRCLLCGKENQICCSDGKQCDTGFVCGSGKCQVCGRIGNPCCEGSRQCEQPESKNGIRAECYSDSCRECGFSGGPACQNEPFCEPGNLKNNNFCFLCGGLNQPCCSFDGGSACNQKEALECVSGFCALVIN